MAFLNQTKNRLIAIATLSGFACAAMIAVLRFAPPSRLGQKDAETAQSLAIWVDLLGAFMDEKLVLPATLNDLEMFRKIALRGSGVELNAFDAWGHNLILTATDLGGESWEVRITSMGENGVLEPGEGDDLWACAIVRPGNKVQKSISYPMPSGKRRAFDRQQ